LARWIEAWEDQGEAKVALKIDSIESLKALQKKARESGLSFYTVHDAGRTQVAAGTSTVIAIGPAPTLRFYQSLRMLQSRKQSAYYAVKCTILDGHLELVVG